MLYDFAQVTGQQKFSVQAFPAMDFDTKVMMQNLYSVNVAT